VVYEKNLTKQSVQRTLDTVMSIKHVRHLLGSHDAIATSIALCTTSMPENNTKTFQDIYIARWTKHLQNRYGQIIFAVQNLRSLLVRVIEYFYSVEEKMKLLV
jgi:hypothetical protein